MNRVKKVCLLCAVFCVTQLYLLHAQSNSDKTETTSQTTQNTWQMQPIPIKKPAGENGGQRYPTVLSNRTIWLYV